MLFSPVNVPTIKPQVWEATCDFNRQRQSAAFVPFYVKVAASSCRIARTNLDMLSIKIAPLVEWTLQFLYIDWSPRLPRLTDGAWQFKLSSDNFLQQLRWDVTWCVAVPCVRLLYANQRQCIADSCWVRQAAADRADACSCAMRSSNCARVCCMLWTFAPDACLLNGYYDWAMHALIQFDSGDRHHSLRTVSTVAQTPLVEQLFELLCTNRKPYSIVSICCGFVVSPQQIYNILTCRDVVDLLWIFREAEKLCICCAFAVQLIGVTFRSVIHVHMRSESNIMFCC
jgi:hypothetical protein